MGTDFVDPLLWLGGPIQSFSSYKIMIDECLQLFFLQIHTVHGIKSLFLLKGIYLSIDNVAVPAEARHHPGYSIRVSQHVGNSHLVEPGLPEGNNGCTTSTVASLVVMVVNEDESIAVGHETPSLSPVPAHENTVLIMKRTLPKHKTLDKLPKVI